MQADQLKYVSLVVLVFQTTALVLIMKYSQSPGYEHYLLTSVVVTSEIVKLIASIVLILRDEANWDWKRMVLAIQREDRSSWIKIAVPSIIYVIQNNLLFVAVANLSPAVYQVSYQLKILTTGVFSVVMLNKTLSRIQWISLVILMIGVALVQMPTSTKSSSSSSSSTTLDDEDEKSGNTFLGLVAVVAASITSGFAGVWFEKVLKGSTTSVWVRNVQLAAIGSVFGIVGMYWKDWEKIQEGGVLQGYSSLVLLVVLLQSVGGLVVAIVIKYADNILKGFATSISIVLSCILSYYLFDFQISGIFMIGVVFVCVSVYLYGTNPYVASSSPITSVTISK